MVRMSNTRPYRNAWYIKIDFSILNSYCKKAGQAKFNRKAYNRWKGSCLCHVLCSLTDAYICMFPSLGMLRTICQKQPYKMFVLQGSCRITTPFLDTSTDIQHYFCICDFVMKGVYCIVFFWQGYVYNKNLPALIAMWRPLNLSIKEKKCVCHHTRTKCALEVWLNVNKQEHSTPEFVNCDSWWPAFRTLAGKTMLLHTVRSRILHTIASMHR